MKLRTVRDGELLGGWSFASRVEGNFHMWTSLLVWSTSSEVVTVRWKVP